MSEQYYDDDGQCTHVNTDGSRCSYRAPPGATAQNIRKHLNSHNITTPRVRPLQPGQLPLSFVNAMPEFDSNERFAVCACGALPPQVPGVVLSLRNPWTPFLIFTAMSNRPSPAPFFESNHKARSLKNLFTRLFGRLRL